MQPDRFTIKSQEALQAAQQLADERRNPQTTPEHVLAVLLEQEAGVVVPVLRKLGVEPAAVRQSVGAGLDKLPKLSTSGEPAGGSGELTQILRTAETEMRELGDEYVSTEHLLLALAAHPGAAGDALRSNGAGHDELLKALKQVRGSHRVTDQNPEDKFQALERYGRDLTDAAAQGKLDPVIGRDDEIRRVIQVLVAPDQEQPGSDRRARSRQDRDRRGPGTANRLGGCARRPARSPRDLARRWRAGRRLQVPR